MIPENVKWGSMESEARKCGEPILGISMNTLLDSVPLGALWESECDGEAGINFYFVLVEVYS